MHHGKKRVKNNTVTVDISLCTRACRSSSTINQNWQPEGIIHLLLDFDLHNNCRVYEAPFRRNESKQTCKKSIQRNH